MEFPKISGLHAVKLLIDGKIPIPPMLKLVPIELTEVSKGRVRGYAIANNSNLNAMGIVHGGFAATVIDTFTGFAVFSTLEVGESHGTVDLNVKMVRPVPKNQKLHCEGRVINISRNLAVSEAHMKDDNGKIYAYGSATCFLKRPDNH